MSEGELIVDNYKLLTALATGQQTQVWEVVDQNNGEKFAMKLLLPEAFKDSAQKAALKFEAKVMESLDHPNIIRYKQLFMGKTHGYLVMELFRAPNLKSQTQGDILVLHIRLKRLIEQLAQGMAHFHDKGWLHKDLKPDNILFSKSAELRIIDFSLSAKMKTGFLSNLSFGKKVIQGTRTYMAPEQIKCQKLGPYTDIYNFGVTLFEMLAGRTPYAGNSPNDLLKKHLTEPVPAPSLYNPNVTPEMDRLVMKMLAKKPENRHKTFNELLAEIRNVSLFKEAPEKMMEQREADKASEGMKEASLNDRRDSRSDAAFSQAKATADAAAPKAAPVAAAPPPSAPQNPPAGPVRVPASGPGPSVPPGMPPRPGIPPGMAPPGGMPPGSLPPGARPPGMPPGPGQPPRPGMPPNPQNVPPGMRPLGAMPPGAPPPGGLPPGVRPPNAPPPGMPPRPGMPPGMAPPGGPRPPGVRMPAGGPVPQRPPGVQPPGMPPRPGMPAVASGAPGGPPVGAPRPPQGMPPPGAPPQGMPRPGMPPPGRPPQGMPPGGPPPGARPVGPGGPPPGGPPRPGMMPPPGAMPPGMRPPAGPRPPGAPQPQAAPPKSPDVGEASLDDFKIT